MGVEARLIGGALLCALVSLSAAVAAEVPDLYQRSYVLEAKGDAAGALDAMAQLPTAERATYLYALRRGWLFYLAGRHDEAVASYGEAIRRAPKAVEPRLGLLLPQLALRRWADAEKTARDVLRIDPLQPTARQRLAWALYNLGRYADAEAVYRGVLDHYPGDVEMRVGVGWCQLLTGRADAAAGTFREVLRVAPAHPSALAGLKAAAP